MLEGKMMPCPMEGPLMKYDNFIYVSFLFNLFNMLRLLTEWLIKFLILIKPPDPRLFSQKRSISRSAELPTPTPKWCKMRIWRS